MKKFLVTPSIALLILSFSLTPVTSFAVDACLDYPAAAIPLLTANGAVIAKEPQTDYARRQYSKTCYLEAWPVSTEQTAALVKIAYQYHVPIRTQGGGHSQNGSSLPQQGELLIHTNAMNKIAILSEKSLMLGSGVPVVSVNEYMKPYGVRIPVVNDGGASGPTAGGYISAGGTSPTSVVYGGFWDQVNEVTLVSGFGKILKVKKSDPNFLWLFGSMGQLGVITEVNVKAVIMRSSDMPKLPIGESITVDFKKNGGRYQAKDTGEHILWLELIVPAAQVKTATNDLLVLQKRYADALRYIPITGYQINSPMLPPLLVGGPNNMVAVRLWGYKIESDKNVAAFDKLLDDYSKMATAKKYHRYIQVEAAGSPEIYQAYFAPSVYSQFKTIKSTLDPEFLFNRGSFFPALKKDKS